MSPVCGIFFSSLGEDKNAIVIVWPFEEISM